MDCGGLYILTGDTSSDQARPAQAIRFSTRACHCTLCRGLSASPCMAQRA